MKQKHSLLLFLLASTLMFAQNKPNILLITVDDVAPNQLSIYTHGMQVPTPNIDRIGKEGALFTDYYAQPSCTAGRAAMMLGQLPMRTGLATVGQPGNPLGISFEDPTIAELLKPYGYATGQFGKNHLGDRNEHLPTVHGFDEFWGNLYHLNVSEEPEQPDYKWVEKQNPNFENTYGPRGVIHSFASTKDDPTTDPRFGRIGKQTVEDTGPLTIERMKTFDDELVTRTKKFIKEAHDAGKPFFVWLATSREHVYIHLKSESKDLAVGWSEDMDVNTAGLMEHDSQIGQVLDYLDQLGITNNTIVMYNSDNGPEQSSWPDGGTTMFRGEKMTTYEGGLRVPFLVRWPGHIKAGSEFTGITDGMDIMPTVYAAVTGNNNLVSELKGGKKVGGKTYKVHLDGYNALDYWTGKSQASPHHEVFYYYETRLTAVRYDMWKIHFATSECYQCDMTEHKMIRLYNLRKDPFEKYDGQVNMLQSMHKSWIMQPIIRVVKANMESFKEFPPRHPSASLNINKVIDKMESGFSN